MIQERVVEVQYVRDNRLNKMGQEASTSSNIQPADIQIPTSLRPIHPFLEDAQRNLCNARKAEDPSMVQKRKKIAVSCINHAFKVCVVLT